MTGRKHRTSSLRLLLVASMLATVTHAETVPGAIAFGRDIRPILASKCYGCHGPDAAARKAGLRLDRPVGQMVARDGTIAVAPGNPDGSELIRRIYATDRDTVMPPPDSKATLTEREKSLIKRWVTQGAPQEQHWSFLPPKPHPVPAVKDAAWPLNPVDHFILAGLEAAGEKPSPEPDRRTLLRRASFDLTGLAPTPRELAAFERDSSPQAFEKQVERLMKSPQFGERMALMWLDLVRYADTDGYHADNPRPVWMYRNYVVSAFNRNMTFDQFTTEQLAGDLVPNASVPQVVASAYNRLVKTTEENGANEKEYLLRYAADRVRNVSSVWLGLTLGCAECHDHKSDPLTARDFYRFSAFFADLQEKGVGKREPALLPSEEQFQQLTDVNREIEAFTSQLNQARERARPGLEAWLARLRSLQEQGLLRWNPVKNIRGVPAGGRQTFKFDPDGCIRVEGTEPAEASVVEFGTDLPQARALRLEVLRDAESILQQQRAGQETDLQIAELELEATSLDGRTRPVRLYDAFADFHLSRFEARHLIDGRRDTSWAVGERIAAPLIRATVVFADPLPLERGTRLRLHVRHNPDRPHSQPRRFRVSLSPIGLLLPDDEILPAELHEQLRQPAAQLTEEALTHFSAYFFEREPDLREFHRRVPELNQLKDALVRSFNSCLVSKSGPPRVTRVLPRGNWLDESGEVVQPGIPAVFGAQPAGSKRLNRADLAAWIVSRNNPLTARVFVNRLWKMLFGSGLVRSLNDFGATGDPPSHPELLDSLAVEFIESNWNIKHIVQVLTTSRAYRQGSTGRPDLEERDPQNRLFARQGRWRLEAEFLRDQALFAAACLVTNIGGTYCYPYQPEGHLDQLDFPQREYEASAGLAQYRRGLYVFRQRTFPHPALTIFDAPSREECAAERPASNNPLQALALLNDPSQVEAARMLAVTASGPIVRSPAEVIQTLAQLALGRVLTGAERSELLGLYQRQLERNRRRAGDSLALLSASQFPVPDHLPPEELAAYTTVARALLNLHETITRY
jgi:hypothetical protein